jgi:hypothetical protein
MPDKGWTDEKPHLSSNYVKSDHHGAREPCGNIDDLAMFQWRRCCDTVYIISKNAAAAMPRAGRDVIMPA